MLNGDVGRVWACAHFSRFSFWRQPRRFFLTSKLPTTDTLRYTLHTTYTHHKPQTQNNHVVTHCAILRLQANQAIHTTIITSVTDVSDCASIYAQRSYEVVSINE